MNMLGGRLIPVDASDFCILSRRAVDALAGVRERHRFMKGLFVGIGYRPVPMLYEPDPRFARHQQVELLETLEFLNRRNHLIQH